MPELKGRQAPGKRLVLGFDGGCSACSELARRIGERLAGKIEVLSLHEPRVEEWREKTLGEDAPLVPTLFEVRGQEVVRAWTGWRLGANLGRFLGPADTWRVMQALDEVGGASEGATPESRRPAGRFRQAVGGLTRGQFLKGVGGAAVAMSVLSSTGKPPLRPWPRARQGRPRGRTTRRSGLRSSIRRISSSRASSSRSTIRTVSRCGNRNPVPRATRTTTAKRRRRCVSRGPAGSGPRRSSGRSGPGSPSTPAFRWSARR